MGINTDVGTGIPTHIQEFDGFDVTTRDANRWTAPTIEGSTLIEQIGGELVFSNNGAGTKGNSLYETIAKFGKIWRITTDLKIETITGYGEIALVLYKDATCYVKIGPYKTSLIDCNCYLRYKNGASPELGVALTGDTIDTMNYHNYTIVVLNDTLILYYDEIMITSIPFKELYNYSIKIEAGTSVNTDILIAKADDYEIINHIDTLLMTIGAIVKKIDSNIGTSQVTDISGNITLTDTTEVFLTFTQATYGTKFRINLFGDLEGQRIDSAGLTPNGGDFVDYTTMANNLVSNSIPLVNTPTAGDCFYFKSLTQFHSLDVYMESGAGNTDNTIIWEYWNGAAWATLTPTYDGTIYNTKVFGKSGRVTWAANTNIISGYYQIRARVTVAGTSKPVATHIQINKDGQTGFDALASVFSTLTLSIYRKRGDGLYALMPTEIGLPYTQCILYRNLAITDLPAWSDIKVGLKLSAAPTAQITIPYTGFIETIEV